ncbi:MAG: cupin domain-containing protein [Erythrobacter sp.]
MPLFFRATPVLAALAVLGACVTATEANEALPSALEAGWKGEPVCELRHQTSTHRVLKCSFAPGVGHERHFHPAHFGYALSGGTMKLTDGRGDRVAEIATGSSYSSDGVEWHQVVNVGDTTVTYLIVEEL